MKHLKYVVPITAAVVLLGSGAAFAATGDSGWLSEARRAYAWFLGRNDLGLPLYDSSTGGCGDGLHHDDRCSDCNRRSRCRRHDLFHGRLCNHLGWCCVSRSDFFLRLCINQFNHVNLLFLQAK